jgi:hypothetical protein
VPLQLGVGLPGGTEIVCHAMLAGIAADTGCLTMQVDFCNEFNFASRRVMLADVAHRVPGLQCHATWHYDVHSRLWL